MEIYNFEPSTGKYIGPGTADIDPLSTAWAGEPRYLIPAHATTEPPPGTGENEAAGRINGEWQLMPDYSNQVICEIDEEGYFVAHVDLQMGEDLTDLHVITNAPDGNIKKPKWAGSQWVDGSSFEELKATKQDNIDAAYDAAISSLPLDPPKERETYGPQYLEAVQWQKDNSFPTPMIDGILSQRQVVGEDKAALCARIIAAATMFGQTAGPLTGKRQRLSKAIEAASTLEELELISW